MSKNKIVALLVCFSILSICPEYFEAFAQGKKKEAKEKGKKKAKKKAKKKLSEEEKLLVKQFRQKAISLYEKEQYEEALACFLKVDEILPTSFTFYHLAKCYDKLYKYEEAYGYFQMYVQSRDKTNLDDVIEAIDRIESMTVVLKVISKPEGAIVFIDKKEVPFQKTPVISEVSAGKHEVIIKKKGFKDVREVVKIPYGGKGRIDVTLVPLKKPVEPLKEEGTLVEEEVEEQPIEKKPATEESIEPIIEAEVGKRSVPISISFAAGVTVSSTKLMSSYIDASLAIFYRIKQAFAGIGIDNLFFTDSYFLAVYPSGGYTLKVWQDLSLSFAGGFGFAYFHAFFDGSDTNGNLAFEKGGYWDLVVHADAKVRYKLGPVMILAVPVHVDILVGAGSMEPSPLAQFAFLVGVAYDF